MTFDYTQIPDNWDPHAVIERSFLGQEIDPDEMECAVLIVAAKTLMQAGLTYDEATNFVDSHDIGLNLEIVTDEFGNTGLKYTFTYTSEDDKDDASVVEPEAETEQ